MSNVEDILQDTIDGLPYDGNVESRVEDLLVKLQNTIAEATSIIDFVGATASKAGTHGLVPAPKPGDENKVLKGDGTWGVDQEGIKTDFIGCTEDLDGTRGLVPAPRAGQQGYVLGANGQWKEDKEGLDIATVVDAIYPVGSIYMSVLNVNPSTRFANTEWTAWGSGKVPVGVDANDSDFNTVEKTGGDKTQSYTPAGTVSQPTFTGTNKEYTPAGTVSQPTFTGTAASLSHSGGAVQNTTLTVNQIPSHRHNINDPEDMVPISDNWGEDYISSGTGTSKFVTVCGSYMGAVPSTRNTGGGGAHNHGFTQPSAHSYTPAGSVSIPTFTGTKANITPSGTVSQPTFTGTAATISHLQPYITCYMWKRVA